MARLLLCPPLLVLSAALGAACAALPAGAANPDMRLPLGLYQIDTLSTMGAPDASYSMHSKVDGATGKVVNRNRIGSFDGGPQNLQGPPVTHCVSSVNMWRLPTLDSNASQCTDQETSSVDGKLVHVAKCPHGAVKLTVRRLDSQRWEYVTEMAMGKKEVPPNLMFLKPTLKDAIVRAKSPLEKAKAEQRLAELDSQQDQMVAKRAQATARLKDAMKKTNDPKEKEILLKTITAMGESAPMTAVSRQIWTRIADTCVAPPPR